MSCCEGGGSHKHPIQWDPTLEQFVKYLTTGNDAIKMKQAIEVGTKSVEYFRGIDFPKWLTKHRSQLETKFPQLVTKADETSDLSSKLGQALIKGGFILRAEHRPLAQRETAETTEDEPSVGGMQIPAHLRDSAKWPRRVAVTKTNQIFDDAGFYVIAYEGVNNLNYLVLAGIIGAVFLACLFPIWPFRLKIAMWYLGVAFSVTMVILIIVRLVLFAALWFAGCDFWFLPNFFNEDVGFVDSFIPAYTFEKRKDDSMMIGVRIFAFILCVGAFYKLSETHSFSDVGNVASKGFLDILDWGHQKLADGPANPEQNVTEPIAATPEEIETQQWNECVKHCEFADYEEFNDFCHADCECINDLWTSNCWKRCPHAEIRSKIEKEFQTCQHIDDEL